MYVKVVKNPSYFSRLQVKYRRRREGKTNYRKRRLLVAQDKNKYNTPKHRLCVRTSNKDITAQIIIAKIQGDVVLAAAYSHELPIHGAVCGLTNFAAAYATGLLLARRMLTKLGLADKYVGVEEATGEDYNVEPEEGRRPFKAYMDTGLARVTTGAKIFGVLKGVIDGGIFVPHSEKRFPGYNRDKGDMDTDVLRERIFAAHVADYQKMLIREEPEKYQETYGDYIAKGIKPGQIEDMWEQCHASIRANPMAKLLSETFEV
jgi:large subunit ribosomal protein L5e